MNTVVDRMPPMVPPPPQPPNARDVNSNIRVATTSTVRLGKVSAAMRVALCYAVLVCARAIENHDK